MVDQYLKDFEKLPGSENRDQVIQLRKNIMGVTQCVWENPELMLNPDYASDLQKVLAMRQAPRTLRIPYASPNLFPPLCINIMARKGQRAGTFKPGAI
jgi:hypothetical protein